MIMRDALLLASFLNSKPKFPNGNTALVFNIFLYQMEILFLMKCILSKLSVSLSSGQAIETA